MPAEPELTALATELSATARDDAAAIDLIFANAATEVAAILAKYSEVPNDVSLSVLFNGRNALASLRTHAQMQSVAFPTPFPNGSNV